MTHADLYPRHAAYSHATGTTNSPSMPARVLRYVTDVYENLIREKPSDADYRLPPVVACVVHNGPHPWDARLDIADLISPTLPQLRDLSPPAALPCA